jgi:ubiquinone/menaquinone biosynthesis C-methylase UbiE
MRIATVQLPIAALCLASFVACKAGAPREIEVAPSSPASIESAPSSIAPTSGSGEPASTSAAPAQGSSASSLGAPSPPASSNKHTDVAPATATTPPSAAPAVADKPVHPNRDKHGPDDVAQYIESLESKSRIAELKVDVVLSKLALPDDAIVGDLGCGPGVFTMAFSKACPNGVVYASDVEPAELDVVAKKIHDTHAHNVVPVLASLDDPHFPPGQLDVVFIADTYHHLDDRVKYMRQLAKALKPGGRLVVLDYKSGPLKIGPPPEHKLPAGVMDKEISEAGWKLLQRFDTHPYHDFEVWRVVQPWEK